MIAVGYPFDGTEEEKVEYMVQMRATLEDRAPIAQTKIRAIIREKE